MDAKQTGRSSSGCLRVLRYRVALVLAVIAGAAGARADRLVDDFVNPPEAARPWTFWYWLEGAVSREGITADIESMKRAGLGGAYLMPIKGAANPPLFTPAVVQLSPEWWGMMRHAFAEADRVGLKIAMHACDGFATAGGPWIGPEQAMQKVVWSERRVSGGRRVEEQLEQPPTNENFYRDIAVLAFPTPTGTGLDTWRVKPAVTCNVPGADAQKLAEPGNTQRLRSEEPCWIQYAFERSFTCRSIFIRPDGANYQALRLILEVSDDGKLFRSLGRLEAPRHGWQDRDAGYTWSVAPVTARYFRLVFDPTGSEEGSEDLDSAKWKNVLKVQGIELSGAPRIPQFEGKSGAVWRRSSRATAAQLPAELCVPLEKIVDVTAWCDVAGRMGWEAPPGDWTILRIGHTPTGHRNETAGGGKGLECDKFDPAAARVQFEGWFGEAVRQAGPELAGRVLKVFHVDSWEAGSQNWSPVFRTEFRRRRGYDPTRYLPAFAGIPVGSADITERFLFDVRRTISELIVDAFYGTMAEQARAHGCEFSGESVAPTMMSDGMRHFDAVDVPMGEFWLRSPTHDKPNDMHDAISGAHVYGKRIVQAEAFTGLRMQWDEHPGMLKAPGDHAFALGVNRLVFHVFMHSPWLERRPGVTLGGVGTFLQRDQIWWRDADGWTGYLRRAQALLQQGHAVADVVYFTGEELPGRAVLPERRVPQLPSGYAADSINRDALLRLATVRSGRLTLPGGASYGVVVLPDTPLMTPELAIKVMELLRGGVTVIGRRPERSPSLVNFPACDVTVQRLGRQLEELGLAGSGQMAELLAKAEIAPDLVVKSGEAGGVVKGIDWTHRSGPDGDVYFVSNQRDTAQALVLSLRGTGRRPELWDAVTGERMDCAEAREEAGRTTVPLRLEVAGSIFVRLREGDEGGRPTVATASARKGGLELREERELAGAWQVVFEPGAGGPEKALSFARLESWSANAMAEVKFYAGTAEYGQAFDWPAAGVDGRVWLDLGRVANVARVTVNGVDCGVAWTVPYRVEITRALRAGRNELAIRVSNTWANRLIGDQARPEGERRAWTNAPWRLEGEGLLPAGLLGPVRVLVGR